MTWHMMAAIDDDKLNWLNVSRVWRVARDDMARHGAAITRVEANHSSSRWDFYIVGEAK